MKKQPFFCIRGVALNKSLATLKKVVGKPEIVYLEWNNGFLWIRAKNEEIAVQIRCDCESFGKDAFGVNLEVLASLTANRQELVFSRENENALRFVAKKGKYQGNLICTPWKKIVVILPDLDKRKISAEVSATLFKWLPKILVTNFFTEEQVFCLIKLDKQGLRMVCADSYHGAAFSHPKLTGNFDINLPATQANIISLFGQETSKDCWLATTESCLLLANEQLAILLPFVVTEKKFDLIFSNSQLRQNTTSLSLERLEQILVNLLAVTEKNSIISCQLQEKTMHLDLSSSFGKVNDQLRLLSPKKFDKTIEFNLEPFLFQELIKKFSKTIDLSANYNPTAKNFSSIVLAQKFPDNSELSAFTVTIAPPKVNAD